MTVHEIPMQAQTSDSNRLTVAYHWMLSFVSKWYNWPEGFVEEMKRDNDLGVPICLGPKRHDQIGFVLNELVNEPVLRTAWVPSNILPPICSVFEREIKVVGFKCHDVVRQARDWLLVFVVQNIIWCGVQLNDEPAMSQQTKLVRVMRSKA